MTPFSSPRSRTQFAWIAVAAIWALLAVMASRTGLIADEWIHFNQASRMRAGDWLGIDPSLTMLTGYHGVMAAVMKAIGAESLAAARWISALSGIVAVWAFQGLRRELAKDASPLPAQQFALLPILLPFVFLVYTDVPSIAMVLGAMWLALRNRHAAAATILLASLLVRQNNVVWAAFIAAWCLWPAMRWRPWRSWRESLRIGVPYALVVAVFAGYWLWHGRISVSETQSYAHPDVSFHVGNAYFALVLLAVMMPLHLGLGLRRFVAKAMSKPAWWLLPLATIALYACCFRVDHEYNRVVPEFNVRNAWLMYVDAHLVAKSLFGLVATLCACALAGNGTATDRGWILLPFAAVALCAAWLIEPRYALVPITFWLAMRRQESAPVEYATLALWGALAVYVATGIFDYRFMI